MAARTRRTSQAVSRIALYKYTYAHKGYGTGCTISCFDGTGDPRTEATPILSPLTQVLRDVGEEHRINVEGEHGAILDGADLNARQSLGPETMEKCRAVNLDAAPADSIRGEVDDVEWHLFGGEQSDRSSAVGRDLALHGG
eukprot:scaffold88701_cov27-Tisochrysis_lutea.AAC.2